MNINPNDFNNIFQQAITDYHVVDSPEQFFVNKYSEKDFLYNFLYKKCWIDTVQWHLEDLIRDPNINPENALKIKRKIDILNQERTDIVEVIDDYFMELFTNIQISENVRINTESVGWAIDRLSILNLKIHHWKEETERNDSTPENKNKAYEKLSILNNQYLFLTNAINSLLNDMKEGNVVAFSFKQMKMYNDPETNPVLRALKK